MAPVLPLPVESAPVLSLPVESAFALSLQAGSSLARSAKVVSQKMVVRISRPLRGGC